MQGWKIQMEGVSGCEHICKDVRTLFDKGCDGFGVEQCECERVDGLAYVLLLCMLHESASFGFQRLAPTFAFRHLPAEEGLQAFKTLDC